MVADVVLFTGVRGADALFLCVLLILGAVFFLAPQDRKLPLPPGPRGLPVIGNLLDIPTKFAWRQYKKWAAEYGLDVISLKVFGQVFVVLNSHAAIKDVVLSERSGTFAGRPIIKFAELSHTNLSLIPFGDRWRARRRVVDHYFRSSSIRAYQRIQQEKVATAMRRLLQKPDGFVGHAREYTAAIVLSVIYGYDVKEPDEPLVLVGDEVNTNGSGSLVPGALLVNMFPPLGELPHWMLGVRFARLVEQQTRQHRWMMQEPFEEVKAGVRNGTAKPSLVRDSLTKLPEGDIETELTHIQALGSAFIGPYLSCRISTIMTFVLAMVLNPDVQMKARTEIDAVVGRDRLPIFEDRPHLPYINALVMEVLRWAPPPIFTGVPHRAEQDVVRGSYCIPEGATVFGNAWAILHDPEAYRDPEAFKPERFLSEDGKEVLDDPILDYIFGFGLRKCPGRHIADATVWLFIASMLAVFEVSKNRAADIHTDEPFSGTGMVIRPLPFRCLIAPRDEQAQRIIQHT
ncbi:cytochrome P450 [Vararia minispora EC-137]|uniref:Cytochrome P450 n=1 Tax=Vararia minispora EC-137 TaxID=1314806 RepID=A0ACB8QP88_9AGAM|nr:cytochrome P450 [Vararia minispora EC-137]